MKSLTAQFVDEVKPDDMTIEGVRSGFLGLESKTIIDFGKGLNLPLNRVNTRTLKKLFGPAPSDWIGQRVSLFTVETSYNNEPVRGVRLRASVPAPLFDKESR